MTLTNEILLRIHVNLFAFIFQGFGDLRTLELLLMCVGHHQYEVSVRYVRIGGLQLK